METISDWVYGSYNPRREWRHTFFTVSLGSMPEITLRDTNIVQPGIIPFSEKFHVLGIGMNVFPRIAKVSSNQDLEDLNRIMDGSWRLVINNKIYQQGPLASTVSFDAKDIGESDDLKAKHILIGNPFFGPKGYWDVSGDSKRITLLPDYPFSFDVEWKDAPSLTNPWFLGIFLFGDRERHLC